MPRYVLHNRSHSSFLSLPPTRSFSASARYRSGYFHARHDLVASKNDTGVLGCTRKFNWEWMCQVCLKMGASKCPDDVRQDCHGGGGGGSGKRRRRVLI